MIDKRIMYYRGGAAQDMGNAENQAASAAAAGSSGTTSGNNDGGYTGPNMADIAGPVTSSFTDADDTRQNYRTDQYTTEPKTKDTDTDETTLTFAPKVTKPPSIWEGIKTIGKNLIQGYVAAQTFGVLGLSPKAVAIGNTALSFGKQTGLTKSGSINELGLNTANSIGDMFGDRNIGDMFSGNNKENTSTSNINNDIGNGGDGEGLASLENQAGGYDEYILLLQKLQSGNISDSERTRYTMLKNMLGI